MCEETGYEGIRKKHSIPGQLCENGFINCDTTIETKWNWWMYWRITPRCFFKSTVNTPDTTDSKTIETF